MAFALALVAGALGISCTSNKDYIEVPVYPVSGSLHVQGEPAYGAYLTFHPKDDVGMTKGNRPFARVAADGTFHLTTYESDDGAPAGRYAVSVYWPENPESRGPSPDRLKGRYKGPKQSSLEAVVEEGETQLPDWNLE